ncbi:hypothetical protein Q8A67_006103 [Cirrhinus molitorella]|uniref:Stromal cell-derived factor 1 n=2 Tax=Cirrhinus molitorella TaxID=172907 RepID=A0AA88TT78_9TELE|nr:hypothetical protein Q8A67_006103 [Cirrhinus molitorella]
MQRKTETRASLSQTVTAEPLPEHLRNFAEDTSCRRRGELRRHTELWKLAVTDKSHTHTLGMDCKVLALVALLTVAIWSPETDAKPISLVERCWCRSTLNTVPQRSIREIKFLHTPSCPFQVIAKLKNNREVCINPKTKWLQQYLKNAISKIKKKRLE